MNFFVALTEKNWFYSLEAKHNLGKEVSHWQTDKSGFAEILPGKLVVFKFKSDNKFKSDEKHRVVGCGVFVRYEKMTVAEAWERFKENNGAASKEALITDIQAKRTTEVVSDSSQIGCIILKDVQILDKANWLPKPDYWNVTQGQPGKIYDSEIFAGQDILNGLKAAGLTLPPGY